VVASGWGERETVACGQPEGSQGVEARSADAEPGGCVAGGEVAVVECGEGFFNDFEGQAMKQLFVFIRASKSHLPLANERLWGSAPNPGV